MRTIPDPGFGADDGSADPALRRELVAAARGGPSGPALARLLRARLLVPVVAMPGEGDAADMAAVLLTGRDGRQALLAFSGVDALQRWRSDARPVPVDAPHAARAALDEGAAAVVVDIAGPATFVLEGDDLQHAAAGSALVRLGDDYGWARPREG